MRIFVSIASYQDPMLFETLASAYVKAKYPENLTFGVLDQSDEPLDIKKITFRNQIKFEHIDPSIAKGPCWARRRIQESLTDEDYYLQIDSHTLFQQGWDELLLTYFNWIKKGLKHNFVITGYPRSFKIMKALHTKDNVYQMNIGHPHTLGITFREERLFEDGHYSMQKNFKPKNSVSRPLRGLLVGGGFIFSGSNFPKEIPYDEKLYFHGEELNLALRLFTNGWDIVHIPRIPVFHQYTDVNNLTRKLHWNPEDESNRPVKWYDLDKKSKQRLTDIIKGEITGTYGLGKKRSLQEFSELCGLDILNKEVIDHEIATKGRWMKELDFGENFEEIEIKNK